MINIRNLLQNKNNHGHSSNVGQGLTEYAIILALVGITVIFVSALLGPTIENVFSTLVAEAEVAPPALLAYTPPPTLPPSPTIDPNVTATTPAPTATSAPPTATNTSGLPTATNTIVPPTASNTAAPPTATNTSIPPTTTNTPAPPTSIPPTATLAPSLELYLEAESGSGLGNWNVSNNGSASNGQYISWDSSNSYSDPSSNNQVTYLFNAPSDGLYQIHLRVDTNSSGDDDSIWVKVDGADVNQSQNITRSDGWVKFNSMVKVSTWTWDQVHNADSGSALVGFYLTAGTHTLQLAYRETRTWVDQIFISNTGTQPTTTSAPTPAPPTPTNTPVPSICIVYNSTDVSQTISSSGTPTINSILNISGSGTINDINVLNLNGQHTWINDLDFNLVSPGGASVQIMARSCSSQNNFNLNLDDEAAPGSWPCPPTDGGTYQPSNALSAFDGQNANGTWTLTIDDNANRDGGSLNGWSLEVCTGG